MTAEIKDNVLTVTVELPAKPKKNVLFSTHGFRDVKADGQPVQISINLIKK